LLPYRVRLSASPSMHFVFPCSLRHPPTPPLFPYTTLFRSPASRQPGPRKPPPAARTPTSPRRDSYAGESRRGGNRSGPMAHCRRSEEHTSELQSRENLVCRLLLEKKK